MKGNKRNTVYQIVVPKSYRPHILSAAHYNPSLAHLGITKTYDRVLKHFLWPGLKSDVAAHSRSCATCQIVGKPNQTIPCAPLQPILAIGELFQHVLVDCVGPLPTTKSGHQYLLTVMCAATRYPEEIPLRKITASAVVRALKVLFHIRFTKNSANRSGNEHYVIIV